MLRLAFTLRIMSRRPCPSFRIAAVMKMLSTFLKTSAPKIALGSPLPFQATIIIACKHNMKKLHILSKLLKMCQNERISTKLTFPTQRSPVF
nr:hypothetical protein Iba_scaffold18314CG0010 [Ipomoea batatas]